MFATNNRHKLEEVRALVGDLFEILSLSDIGCHEDIVEDGNTLEDNALIKARFVKGKYGYDCFSDDTGLFVDALGGEPGVMTARYAGEHCSPHDNIVLMLENMKGMTNRKAEFVTVVALEYGDSEHTFTGCVKGSIAEEPSGTEGFGYDPIFVPDETGIPFAEMSGDAKNEISHRGRAIRNFISWLRDNTGE